MNLFLRILLGPLNILKGLLVTLPGMLIKGVMKLPFKIIKGVLMPIIFLTVVVVLPILIGGVPGGGYDGF